MGKIIIDPVTADKITDTQTFKIEGINLTFILYYFPIVEAPRFGNIFCVYNGVLTFNPKPDTQEYLDDEKTVPSPDGRIELRPSKLINYLLENCGYNITIDSDDINKISAPSFLKKIKEAFVERATNIVKSINLEIPIEVTDDIAGTYMMEHAKGRGTLSKSCMRYGDDYFTDFYDDLKSAGINVQILRTIDNGQLTSRALLWHGVKFNDGNEYSMVDRIYGTFADEERYKQYARDNGYCYKVEQSYDVHKVERPDGKSKCIYWIDYNKPVDFEGISGPYMDTFFEFNNDNLRCGHNEENVYATLRHTDGQIDIEGGLECVHCGDHLSENNAIQTEERTYCQCCYNRYVVECSNCEREIDTELDNETIYEVTHRVNGRPETDTFCSNCVSER